MQDQSVDEAGSTAIVIGPTADLYKPACGVERSGRGIVLGDFEKQGSRPTAARLLDKRRQQRRPEARPPALGEDTEGQNFAFPGEALGQRQSRGLVVLPGNSAKNPETAMMSAIARGGHGSSGKQARCSCDSGVARNSDASRVTGSRRRLTGAPACEEQQQG